jgi:plastocyanin
MSYLGSTEGKMRGRTLLLLAATMAVLVLALLVGCGGGGGQPQQQEEEPAEQRERNPQPQQEEEAAAGQGVVKTIRIEETEFKLQPAEITLDKPGTYVFEAVNSGDTVHALEVEGEGIEEETKEIQPGQSAKLEVELEAGTYELYCPVGGHKEEGMEGTLTVKEGSGGSGGY